MQFCAERWACRASSRDSKQSIHMQEAWGDQLISNIVPTRSVLPRRVASTHSSKLGAKTEIIWPVVSDQVEVLTRQKMEVADAKTS